MSRPILVGESNPYSRDPNDALLPYPAQSAGARLCRMLGCSEDEYLRRFYRANLCVGMTWNVREARRQAEFTLGMDLNGEPIHIVMLGAKVSAAFGQSDQGVWSTRGRFTRIPHPSGLCREWAKPGAVERLRSVMRPWTEIVETP